MKVCIIGLGRMGNAVAYRLHKAGFSLTGYDPDTHSQQEAQKLGVQIINDLAHVPADAVVWLMVPAGKIVDDTLTKLLAQNSANRIIIDGGNSHYTDTIKRAALCVQHNVQFIDCGTSGGLHGRRLGFSLMVGGEKQTVKKLEPLFLALAAPEGFGYMGPTGAGHYVKMIHNGIEYALLQAYAEGFDVLKHGYYKDLDLTAITQVWGHGSIIRSWLVDLAHHVYKANPDFSNISGKIDQSGTGKWTVEEAHRAQVPVRMIEEALKIRAESQKTGGNYATKMVALLRHEFGGHKVHFNDEEKP